MEELLSNYRKTKKKKKKERLLDVFFKKLFSIFFVNYCQKLDRLTQFT